MKIKILKSFSDKFIRHLQYITADKPKASIKFKRNLLSEIKKIIHFPHKHRKSIFFENEDIRDLVYK
jgi:plasmid stabilization system protein ParE